MITLTDVSKRYGDIAAVEGLTFTVEKGQVLGLLGQNGAGKTTTLNILTGYLAPTAGKVTIGGYDLLSQPRLAKRQLGYLPEVPPLYDEMTVRSALAFACRLKLVVDADIPGHIAEIAGQTGLSDMLERRIGNLSRGYRQRVGLAQALCGDPEALVLDEPTNGLDPRQTAEFRQTLWRLAQGRTVIFSSHILSEVQALCHRVIILHHGHIVYDNSLKSLRQDGPPRLRLDALCSEKKLIPALEKLPGVLSVQQLPAPEPGAASALICCQEGERPQKRLFSLLTGLNAPILRLQETENSLEEVFLRVTAEE